MAPPPERRRIDWRVILDGEVPSARRVSAPVPALTLSTLTSEATSNPSAEAGDRLLQHAVDFAKSAVGFERSAIYLLDSRNGCMVGTWGTDAEGNTIDEHGVMYDYGPIDREVFERAEAGFPWTVYEDCPLIANDGNETRILGRGWVGCTAILGPEGPLGILFNDTALTRAPIDEAKQWRGALLCSLLGRALWHCKAFLVPSAATTPDTSHPIVRRVTELLMRDPTLSCEAMAQELSMTSGSLARAFKRATKSSIVEYRNELRLASFLERVDASAGNLLEAALASGFGSYAQFHRVFRARFGRPPREYLLERKAAQPLAARDRK